MVNIITEKVKNIIVAVACPDYLLRNFILAIFVP